MKPGPCKICNGNDKYNDGRCRPCGREKARVHGIKYRAKNPEKVKKRAAKYYATHKEQIKFKERKRRIKNPTYFSDYNRKRAKEDIQFKLSKNLRSRLHDAVRHDRKGGSAVRDLGCTIGEFKLYLESLFKPGMSWDNWSITGWHIDHIVPLVKFDLSNREQFLKACHYTNLQPLWYLENVAKGGK